MQSPTATRPSIYHFDERNLEEEPYFFNDISIEKAAEILFNLKKEGAFLIRKRSVGYTPSLPYSLSVYYDQKVHHTRIKCDKDGRYLTETRDQNPKKFSSIPELVNFLNQEAILKLTTRYNNLIAIHKNNCKLIEKVDYEAYDLDSLNDLPYYLGNCNREEVEGILNDIKQNEVFFIRDSPNTPNSIPFELIVYYKSNVYNLKITRSPYDAYCIENIESKTFETIPDMIRYYNYNKLKVASSVSCRLQIYSRYINRK